MDNSPMWDQIMQRLHLRADQIPKYRRADIHTVSSADRPTSTAYDRFAYLVKFFADREYDEARIRSDCPFLVQDVLFNSLLCKANRDLAEIARVIGEDPSSYDELAEKTKVPSTRNSGTRIAGYTWTTILPMTGTYAFTSGQTWRDRYMLVFPARIASRMLDTLENDGFGLSDENITPIPSYDLRGYGFSEDRYWRGPVWININWFLMHGLEAYGYKDHAERMRRTIVDLCRREVSTSTSTPPVAKGLDRSSSPGRRRCS